MTRPALALLASLAACAARGPVYRPAFGPDDPARAIAPRVAPPPPAAPLEAQTFTFANGLQVIVAARPTRHEVRVSLVLRRAGGGGDPRATAVARATFEAMQRLYNDAAGDAFTARLAPGQRGTYTRTISSSTWSHRVWTWTVAAPPEALPDVLYGIARSVRNVAPDAASAVAAHETATLQSSSTQHDAFGQRLNAERDRDVQEATALLGLAAPVDAEPGGGAAMAAWARAHYVPEATSLVVQGPFDAEAARSLAARFFGDWEGPSPPPEEPPTPPPPSSTRVVLVPSPPGVRVGMTLLARMPAAAGRERAIALTLELALCGAWRSRVQRALRQERADLYSPSSVVPWSQPVALACHVEVEPSRAVAAVATLLSLAREVAARGLTADEVDGARRSVMAGTTDGLATSAGYQSSLVAAAWEGYAPEQRVDPTTAALAALDVATVNTFLARELLPERTHVIVRGDLDALPVAALEAAVGGSVAVAPAAPRVPHAEP